MNQSSFYQTKLGSGLTVIGERIPGAQSVAAGIFVGAGSQHETVADSGVSHFLEHMLFKGTRKRSADDINREFDELGASFNAYTSEERTVYYAAVLPDRLSGALDLLIDMMAPALRGEDFEVERKVILEEIGMYLDRPYFRVFDEANLRYFRGHPYGNSILGTPNSIDNLTPARMREYFEASYRSDNLLLTICGDFTWDKVIDQVCALTSKWSEGKSEMSCFPRLFPETGDQRIVDESLNRVHMATFSPGVSASDSRRYAAAILGSIVGDSIGSRLYWALIDKGLADTATLSHNAAAGYGAYMGYLSFEPDRELEIRNRFSEVIQEITEEGPTESEWSRVKQKLATGLMLRMETPYGRLMPLGIGFQQLGVHQSLEDVLEGVKNTAIEDGKSLLKGGALHHLFNLTLAPK
jgi:predicted Zn-dependent peptidase